MKLDEKSIGDVLGDGAWWVLSVATSIAIFVGMWTAILHIGLALQGAGKCRDAFSTDFSLVYEPAVETNNFMTRILDDHFISGVVMQPKDVDKDEYTVICHFKGNSFDISRIEISQGNKIDRIKAISVSSFHPKTYRWKWFLDNLGVEIE